MGTFFGTYGIYGLSLFTADHNKAQQNINLPGASVTNAKSLLAKSF